MNERGRVVVEIVLEKFRDNLLIERIRLRNGIIIEQEVFDQ